MRDLLTGIAVVLLLVLVAAMGVPHFVNWGNHRERVAASLSDALGTKVNVKGAVSITLLPVPRLKVSGIELADQGAMSGEIAHIRAEAAVANLLRGELRLTSVLLIGASLKMKPGEMPTALKMPTDRSMLISVGSLQIENSSVSMADAPPGVSPLLLIRSGDMEATSLSGPFKGAFSVVLNGRPQSLRFSTSAMTNEGLRLRALLENEQSSIRSEWEGLVTVAAGMPQFAGRLTASGVSAVEASDRPVNLVWRLAGKLQLTDAQAQFDDVDLTIGPGDRQLAFKGSATAALGALVKADVKLQARQIDLDRLLADTSRGQTIVALRDVVHSVRSETLTVSAGPPIQGTVHLTAQSMIVGGEVVSNPEISLAYDKGHISLAKVLANLPGNVIVEANRKPDAGSVEPVTALRIDGADHARFLSWYHARPLTQRTVRRTFSVRGDLVMQPDAVRLQNAVWTLDRLTLSGEARLLKGGQRVRIDGDIQLRDFDLGTLPEILKIEDPDPNTEIHVRLIGSNLKIGQQQVDRLSAAIEKDVGKLTAKNIDITGPNGLQIAGSASISNAAVTSDLAVRARDVDDLLALAERFAPQLPAIATLRNRARELSPIDLRTGVRSSGVGGHVVKLSGKVATSNVELDLLLNEQGALDGTDSVQLEITNPRSDDLLRQFGATPLPLVGMGPARVKASGGWTRPNDHSVPLRAEGVIAGTAFNIEGRKTLDPEQQADGRLELQSKDIYPLAASLGIAFPDVQPGQDLTFSSAIDLRGLRITLRQFQLQTAGQTMSGEIAFDLLKFGRISGQIKADHLHAESFAPLISGTDQKLGPAQVWSSLPFQASIRPALPGDLWFEAKTLTLPEGIVLSEPGFVFRFDRNLAYVEYGRARFHDAPLEMSATIRRTDKLVTFAGRVSARRLDLAKLGRQQDLKGLLTLDIDMNVAGDSALSFMSSLAGNGRASMSDLAVAVPDPAYLDRLVSNPPDDSQALVSNALNRQLAQAPTVNVRPPDRAAGLALSGGVLRFGPTSAEREDADVGVTLTADLRQLSISPVISTTLRRSPNRWDGPPPSYSLTWRASDPQERQIDAKRLSNGLLTLQIRRELDRIDVLEQDQREVDSANRRLKRSVAEERELDGAKQRLERLRQEAAREASRDAAERARNAPLSIVPTPFPLPAR